MNGVPIGVGLVGFGGAGEGLHAPLIEATEGMELAAVVTSDPQRRRRAVAAYPAVALFDDVAGLLAAGHDLGLEMIVVAAPNRAHEPVALAAVEAGYAVVVDKPLATTAAAGRRVVAAAEARGVVLSVFQNRRWDGDFLTVCRLRDAGVFGQVLRFESRFERWRPQVSADRWRERADPEEGGGLLLDLGSHLVDQALFLFGTPTSVYAELKARRPGAAVDDDVFISLTHPGGVISHLWASAVAARPGPRFRVQGDRAGYVAYGMDVQEMALAAGERPGGEDWGRVPEARWGTLGAGDEVHPVPSEKGDYCRFYQGMVAALTEGGPPPVPPSEALGCLEILDAARLAAATGQIAHLQPR